MSLLSDSAMKCLSNYVHASSRFEGGWEFARAGCDDGSGTGDVFSYYFVKVVSYFWLGDIEIVFCKTYNVCTEMVHVVEE